MITKQKLWRDPRFDEGPSGPLVAGSALWESIGTIGTREFGTIAMPGFEGHEFELIPDGPVLALDAGTRYLDYNEDEPYRWTTDEYGEDRLETIGKFRRLVPWPLGHFDKLTKPKAGAKVKDSMPVDALTGLSYLGGRAPTRQTIVARLANDGVTVSRGSGGELLPSLPGGRWPKPSIEELLRKPGIGRYLAEDIPCAWPHDGEAPLAMTLDMLGNGLCSAKAHRAKPATGIVGKLRAAVGLT